MVERHLDDVGLNTELLEHCRCRAAQIVQSPICYAGELVELAFPQMVEAYGRGLAPAVSACDSGEHERAAPRQRLEDLDRRTRKRNDEIRAISAALVLDALGGGSIVVHTGGKKK